MSCQSLGWAYAALWIFFRRPGLADAGGGRRLVPGVGVEPTLLAEPDFESGASANSATRARVRETRNGRECA